MTGAQKKALSLLELIDKICGDNNWLYTLGNMALIYYEYEYDEDYFDPNSITMCLLYEDYRKLLNYLIFHKKELNLQVINYENTDNFDNLSSWIMFEEKNILPRERERDEYLYRTRLILTPIFYAGDNEQECVRTCEYVKRVFRYLDCRLPLPHKRLFSSIEGKISRTKQRFYCATKKMYGFSVAKLISHLSQNQCGREFLFFKNQSNSISWMYANEFEVERVSFFGIATNVIKNRGAFIERNCPNESKKGLDKVSELLLRGGRDLRRIQLIQLDMLKEIDRICRKHNLKYNIAFGTLLGAVRHGGFIPWDDDADINMPYEDYLKLIEVIDNELDQERYYFRYQDKEKDCNITYAHLKRNGTIYTKRGREEFTYHPGIYIDIVPLYNGAPNLLFHSIQTRICWTLRTACWAYMGANSEKKSWKRIYYKQLAKIGNKRAYELFVKAATFFKKKRNKMLFLNGADRSPYNIGFVKRECFDDPIEIEFEGYKFFAPRDFNSVLEYCYGKDYMRYLPVAKRHPKNDVIIDISDLYCDI